ncbi:MAG: DUF1850 domain-containing protein [Deltaproteobacteria bacterium]|nr:DUF1850 domain-containing protein [Deltaproteobacteria bacterium]
MKKIFIPLLFVFSFLWGCNKCYYLTLTDVTNRESPKLLLKIPVKIGEKFKICYTHSWDLTPVDDIFVIGKNGTIIIDEEIFNWFGAGLEHNPPRGKLFIGKDKRIHVKNINRNVKSFRLRVGIVANHRLVIKDKTIPLNSLTKPMNSIEFKIVKY